MDTLPPQNNTDTSVRSGMVHFILSHSYIVFLCAVVLGAIAHMFISIHLFDNVIFSYLGFVMLIIGPIIIYWAQYSSSCALRDAQKQKTERDFERGPYKYSRNPTHIGLTIMTLGLGFILNSFFTVVFIIIASIITKFFFLTEEEALLEKEYGDSYRRYKHKVSTWV